MSARIGDRVHCRVCGRSYAPIKSGKVRTHPQQQVRGSMLLNLMNCPGGGQEPREATS